MPSSAVAAKPDPAPSAPPEVLVEAHKELAPPQAHAVELRQERTQAAEVVEHRKAERTPAEAYADTIREKALAEKVAQRPVELIEVG
jgi:hypothetical protein